MPEGILLGLLSNSGKGEKQENNKDKTSHEAVTLRFKFNYCVDDTLPIHPVFTAVRSIATSIHLQNHRIHSQNKDFSSCFQFCVSCTTVFTKVDLHNNFASSLNLNQLKLIYEKDLNPRSCSIHVYFRLRQRQKQEQRQRIQECRNHAS
jgi:hypothetical protein